MGNVIAGIPLDANGDFTGTFFTLLTPFTLSCGVLGLVHMLVQGSAWIALKAPEDAEGAELAERARALRGKLVLAEALVFAFVSACFFVSVVPNGAGVEVTFLAAFFAVLYAVSLLVAGRGGCDLGCAALVGIAASTLFPNLINATKPAFAITIEHAAGSDLTLAIMLGIALIGVPIVLVYHVVAYRVFRGRLKRGDLTY